MKKDLNETPFDKVTRGWQISYASGCKCTLSKSPEVVHVVPGRGECDSLTPLILLLEKEALMEKT